MIMEKIIQHLESENRSLKKIISDKIKIWLRKTRKYIPKRKLLNPKEEISIILVLKSD